MDEEKRHLKQVCKVLNQKIQEMEEEIFEDKNKIQEFHKYMWENKSGMDKQELNSVRSNNEQEAKLLLQTRDYFKKLLKIKDSPYFASIEILNEKGVKEQVYLGMTYLKKANFDQLIYDWRAPICSIFYDYETGPVEYITPNGVIKSHLYQKKQYKIEHQELKRIINSDIHIEDEVLQEVLAKDSGDKMKHIVTTIQQEQNLVIRNTLDKDLIVQGFAGSGKTSVALHRIAFLLYKIPNLSSKQILIFSPNDIFTEYISDVLPTLGEENTLQTTFHDYLNRMIKEYKSVESFPEFLKRYYLQKNQQDDIFYKQSDSIIFDLEKYVEHFVNHLHFQNGFCENHVYEYSKEELDELFHQKYNQAPLFERINQMAQKFSEQNYCGSSKKKATYHKLILEALNLKKDYRILLLSFFESSFYHSTLSEKEKYSFKQNKLITYDNALIFVYLKGLLEGFPYDNTILQIVIDEAQDYSLLQYKILQQIFKKASFTILGDIHQGINPFYQYQSLEDLKQLWEAKYIELNKTYRSSPEIIEYANRILNLHHVYALQKKSGKPVLFRNNFATLIKDITYLKENHKSIALITHDNVIANHLYEFIKDNFRISLLLNEKDKFQKDLVIIPAYLAKGLEFDSVIVYQEKHHRFLDSEKNLYYVAVTRAQHELIVYDI